MNKRWPKYGQNANKNFGICINDNAFYSSSENTPPIAIGYHRMGVVHTCVTKKAEASVYECFGLQIYGYGLPVYRLHRAGQNYGAIRFRMHFQYPAGLLQKNCH